MSEKETNRVVPIQIRDYGAARIVRKSLVAIDHVYKIRNWALRVGFVGLVGALGVEPRMLPYSVGTLLGAPILAHGARWFISYMREPAIHRYRDRLLAKEWEESSGGGGLRVGSPR